MNTKDWIYVRQQELEHALSGWVRADAPADLGEAMRYGVLDGGKRLRPLLVLAAHEAAMSAAGILASTQADAGRVGDTDSMWAQCAMRAACAVELIHAYSLVHDDMPCMDNDTLRRGKPTVHVRYGQAFALLAGDAMQSLAFEVLTPEDAAMPAATQARLCQLLARAAGAFGMAGGQAIDLASVGKRLDQPALQHMHALKTGALLRVSLEMGYACAPAQVAQACPQAYEALKKFGDTIGLAFQVVDDVLDATADTAVLGKTAGKDAADDKPTYVSLMGIEQAKRYAGSLHQQAQAALRSSGLPDTQRLADLADWVIERAY